MSNYLENRQRTTSPIAKITGGEAAKLIGSSPSEDLNVVGFEAVEARRLGVKRGDSVLIAPRDTGMQCPIFYAPVHEFCSFRLIAPMCQ